MPLDPHEDVAERILRWQEGGPALFAYEALGAEPTEQQWEASRELVKRRRVSIRSGHGTGKSAFMAWTILWAMTCFHPVKVGATAPSATQIHDVVWSELGMWHARMAPALRQEFKWTGDRFERVDAPQEAFAVARTSRKEQPEALQGLHSDNMFFLIDEASGVYDEVFQVAEGSMSTPGAYVLMAGNPTRMEGYFYRSHHENRANWAALHWNGEDSPLVAQSYILEQREQYGETSSVYKIRVRGEFAGNPDGIISLDVIESAIGREVKPFGAERWGVDVARFGPDRTSLCKRRSNAMQAVVRSWRGKDTMQTAGLIKLEYDEADEKPEAIFVDVIGLGAGVVDRCRELELPVVGVNVSETPAIKDQYNRLRDELWFKAKDWFYGRDVSMVRDDALIAELTLPTYKVLSNGKKQVESKDDMKKRGVTSPDLADAFCLTFASGIPMLRPQKRTPSTRFGKPGGWMR